MGRALAVSKLQSIKAAVNNLSVNFKKEAEAIDSGLDSMLERHQPAEVDTAAADKLNKKVNEVIA